LAKAAIAAVVVLCFFGFGSPPEYSTKTMKTVSTVRKLSQPCRNFNFQSMLSLVDPADSREKLVLSNYVGGGRGTLIFIDVETLAAEEIPLPGDGGAWALAFDGGNYVMVGTNMTEGLVCRLDLTTRTWAEPLHNDKTSYHWNVAKGSDGFFYFTTYPTAEVLRYDAKNHELRSIGRPTAHSGNLYSKEISGACPGWIVVTGGYAESFVSAWNIATETWVSVTTGESSEHFTLTEARGDILEIERDGVPEYYAVPDFRPIPEVEVAAEGKQGSSSKAAWNHSTRLRDGRRAGVAGQEYFIENAEGEKVYHRISFDPPITGAHKSLVRDANGDIWGASSFGQTIFRYSVSEDTHWNSLGVCESMGEVYGMVALNGLIFMASYAGGDHVIYDPQQPWDQRNNINPRTLKKVSERLCRPVAGCTVGPDGAIWSGWRSKYGTYGGAISRIDPETFELKVWDDPIPEQTVMGIAADERFLYFTTNPSGEGVPMRDDPPGWFVVWSPGDGMQAKFKMAPGEATAGLIVHAELVFIIQKDRLAVFDPAEKGFRDEIVLGGGCGALVKLDGGILAAVCGRRLVWVDAREGTVLGEEPLETGAFGTEPTADGRSFYYTAGTELYHLQPPDFWGERE